MKQSRTRVGTGWQPGVDGQDGFDGGWGQDGVRMSMDGEHRKGTVLDGLVIDGG